jgi:hypothetical protein
MRFKYSKLGLKLVSLEENHSFIPKKPSMVEENKNDREDDSINMFLEQALVGTGADPGFNASTTHQQNPNYQPFRQHLRSR